MKNLFIVILSIFTFQSCGTLQSSVSADGVVNDPLVNDFLARFNKEEFILKVEKERSFYEILVKELKDSDKLTPDLQLKYTDTQRAYNGVLKQMSHDIMEVNNILGFQLFDSNARYTASLNSAAQIGAGFTRSAMNAMGRDYDSVGVVSFAVSKLFPLIKKVEQIYLDHVQSKMVARISNAEFRFFHDI